MYTCRQVYADGGRCTKVPHRYQGYCYWHLVMQRMLGPESSAQSIFIKLVIWVSGAGFALAMVQAFWKVANTPDVQSVVNLYYSVGMSGLFLTLGAIYGGQRQLFWPKIASVFLVMVILYFGSFTVVVIGWPQYQDLALSNPSIANLPHRLLVAATFGLIGAYFVFMFAYCVLLMNISRTVYLLVLGLYCSGWILFYMYDSAPLVPLAFVTAFIGFILNVEFNWLAKVRGWLNSVRY